MKLLVQVMFWLDVLVLMVLIAGPYSPSTWMWVGSLMHLAAAAWMWHTGRFDLPSADYQQLYEAEREAHRTNREASDQLFEELRADYQQVIEFWKAEEQRAERMGKLFYEYYYTGNGHAKRYVDRNAVN